MEKRLTFILFSLVLAKSSYACDEELSKCGGGFVDHIHYVYNPNFFTGKTESFNVKNIKEKCKSELSNNVQCVVNTASTCENLQKKNGFPTLTKAMWQMICNKDLLEVRESKSDCLFGCYDECSYELSRLYAIPNYLINSGEDHCPIISDSILCMVNCMKKSCQAAAYQLKSGLLSVAADLSCRVS